MIIKNFKNLANTSEKKIILKILESALENASPYQILKRIIKKNTIIVNKNKIHLSKYDRIFTIAIGKAADTMTDVVNSIIEIKNGIVVIPNLTKSKVKNKKFQIIHAGHPIPNNKSVFAANKIIKFLKQRQKSDLVIFLISGGGSSLVSLPDGITLAEKKTLNSLLIKSGANIKEINCVRKHFSKIKGGEINNYLCCDAISLVMSDVINDDLSSISSGITYFDTTTFNDAANILKKYDIEKIVPSQVRNRLYKGLKNEIREKPKRTKIKNYVVARNSDCLKAMDKEAHRLGLATKLFPHVSGDVKIVARRLIKNTVPGKCVIFGGETTVKVVGRGKGGRNQELVLYIVKEAQNNNKIVIAASIGTDGIDGNTDASGSIASSTEFDFNESKRFLQNNNSYSFHKKHNNLIFTGPTHTNLMDVGILLSK